MDPNCRSPTLYRQWDEAVVFFREIAHAIEFRQSAKPALKVISPTVIAKSQLIELAAQFWHNNSGTMATNVMEGAQHAGLVAQNDQRFASDFDRNERARFGKLIGPCHRLPAGEDSSAFHLVKIAIEIP